MLPTSLWTRKQFETSALNQAWIHVSMSMATACVTSQRYPEPSRAGLASPMILLPLITLGSAHLLDRKPALHSVGSWVSCLSVLRPSAKRNVAGEQEAFQKSYLLFLSYNFLPLPPHPDSTHPSWAVASPSVQAVR